VKEITVIQITRFLFKSISLMSVGNRVLVKLFYFPVETTEFYSSVVNWFYLILCHAPVG